MKAFLIAIALNCLFFIAALAAGGSSTAEPPADAAVGIRHFMQNPQKYQGAIELKGIVSRVDTSRNLVELIDFQEYKECKVVTCALLRLPVYWQGELPEVFDIVRVRGEVGMRDGKRLFKAETLQKVGQVNGKE